jgi:hypothetical protein
MMLSIIPSSSLADRGESLTGLVVISTTTHSAGDADGQPSSEGTFEYVGLLFRPDQLDPWRIVGKQAQVDRPRPDFDCQVANPIGAAALELFGEPKACRQPSQKGPVPLLQSLLIVPWPRTPFAMVAH